VPFDTVGTLSGVKGWDCQMLHHLTPSTNIICVAGGTGITYVLPVLLNLARQQPSPGGGEVGDLFCLAAFRAEDVGVLDCAF
jgi:hypothetical protein